MSKKDSKNKASEIEKSYIEFKQKMNLLRKEQNFILKEFLEKVESDKLAKTRKKLKK